jgi:hypothetical protein
MAAPNRVGCPAGSQLTGLPSKKSPPLLNLSISFVNCARKLKNSWNIDGRKAAELVEADLSVKTPTKKKKLPYVHRKPFWKK